MKRSPLLLFVLLLAACPGELMRPDPDPPKTDGGTASCTPQVSLGTPLRLLTRAEYTLSVRDLLGATNSPAADFPREPLSHLLDNDATLNQVTDAHVMGYLNAAEALSKDTLLNRKATVLPCASEDQACGEQFIALTGRRAFRRPLSAEESTTLKSLFSSINGSAGFSTAVSVTLQTMLQSPQFLYRDESVLAAVPQPTVTLGGNELASRLSYFLWGTMPDDRLLDAAANGELASVTGITAQAERMLDDPRAIDGQMRFFSLWLSLDAVGNTEKAVGAYPQYSANLSRAWKRSLELYVQDVLTHEGTLASLLTSNVLFTNDTMSMYGPASASSEFVRTEMTGTQRKGLLTQPGFLAYKAMPDGSSPVRRGIFVLDQLMCEVPPPPPAAFTPPQPSTTTTTRQRFTAHSQNAGCVGCHQFIDPVGFTFENYDGMGLWRDTENGQPIDASGGVKVSSHPELIGDLVGVAPLSEKLAASPWVHNCFSQSMVRFALGRPITAADECTVNQVSDAFYGSGGSFKALMLAIVQSNAFRTNANPEMTP